MSNVSILKQLDKKDGCIAVGHVASTVNDTCAFISAASGSIQGMLNVLTEHGECAFYSVATDQAGNSYCVGYVASDISSGLYDALLVKFDGGLHMCELKRFSSGKYNCFHDVIVTDTQIICSGSSGGDELSSHILTVISFDHRLNLLSKSRIYLNETYDHVQEVVECH